MADPVIVACALQLVATQYRVSVEDIVGRSLSQRFVRPRQVALYVAWKATGAGAVDLAPHFNRSADPLYHQLRKFSRRLDTDLDLQAQVTTMLDELGGALPEGSTLRQRADADADQLIRRAWRLARLDRARLRELLPLLRKLADGASLSSVQPRGTA